MSVTIRREMGLTYIATSATAVENYIEGGQFSTSFFLPVIVGTAIGAAAFVMELCVFHGSRSRKMPLLPIWKFANFLLMPRRTMFLRKSAFETT